MTDLIWKILTDGKDMTVSETNENNNKWTNAN